jgi:ATP/maltotriose-dependent transcriptional regulator MalT
MNWLHAVLSWLQTIPDQFFQTHPRLGLTYILLLLLTGQLSEALMRLEEVKQAATRVLAGSTLHALLNEANAFHAYLLFLQGDLKGGVALAERALERLDDPGRCTGKHLFDCQSQCPG